MTELPAGFTIRRPTPSDGTSVVDLLNACSLADIGLRNFTLDVLQRQWGDDEFHLETDAWIVTDSAGQVAGYADFFEETPPDPYEVTSWGASAADRHRSGGLFAAVP